MRTHSAPKRVLVGSGATVALALGTAFFAAPAFAAETTVDDVTLEWGLSLETGAGAYDGSCNYLSAGVAGDSGSSRKWTEEDGFFASQSGNVEILRPLEGGAVVQQTWADRCLGPNGVKNPPFGVASSQNYVSLSNGTGTVDVAAGTANINWDGGFTLSFYDGLTYWSVSDPILTVADGAGTLTGTASGYAASMEDTTVWGPIAPEVVTLATLSDVELTEAGLTVTPDYAGVVNGLESQNVTNPGWGSFPADMVAFLEKTGAGSYWYSSGGAADPRKVTTPLSVAFSAGEVTPPAEGEELGSNEVEIGVTVPETEVPNVPGKFEWTLSNNVATLGTAAADGNAFTATGTLPTVTVTDTREAAPAWSVNGKVSQFADGSKTFDGGYLGWAPVAPTNNTTDAAAGAAVTPAANGGLSGSATLASAPAGHALGSADLSAALQLRAPLTVGAGSYKATLTLTAIG